MGFIYMSESCDIISTLGTRSVQQCLSSMLEHIPVFIRFGEGRESVEDEARVGCPRTS